jgi:hypothetical protein
MVALGAATSLTKRIIAIPNLITSQTKFFHQTAIIFTSKHLVSSNVPVGTGCHSIATATLGSIMLQC